VTTNWNDTVLVGAAVTGAASILAFVGSVVADGRRRRIHRQRREYSRAFAAVAAYREFPYVIRRRRASDPEGERVRISTELRRVQQDLSQHLAWLRTESTRVANAYAHLVETTRAATGRAMQEAWEADPISTDQAMNLGDLGIPNTAAPEDAYLTAVCDHLSIWPDWVGRLGRWCRSEPPFVWLRRLRA